MCTFDIVMDKSTIANANSVDDISCFLLQELCKVPKLVVEGVSCDDLNEGELGNTWFVSACSALAQDNRLWVKVRGLKGKKGLWE